MASDAIVRARIDEQVKNEAAQVLAEMGLTVSDAIRLMLIRVAAERALPFPVKVPNVDKAGKLPAFESVADLMADLNAAD